MHSSKGAQRGIEAFLPAYTLEVTAKDVAQLEAEKARLPHPRGIFVPYLPNETEEQRLEAAKAVAELGYEAVAHISARRILSEAQLEGFLQGLEKAGVKTVLIIAGDPAEPMGPYSDALAVIRSGLLERHGIRKVCIAGHPEGHPNAEEPVLWQYMKDKAAALKALGMECEIVTQFSFDPDPVLDWIKKVRANGVDAPIAIGIPGPASVKTLLRFAARCGVGASSKAIAKYGLSLTRLLNKTGPDKFLAEFLDRYDPKTMGAVYPHVYPFGGFADTADWLSENVGVTNEPQLKARSL